MKRGIQVCVIVICSHSISGIAATPPGIDPQRWAKFNQCLTNEMTKITLDAQDVVHSALDGNPFALAKARSKLNQDQDDLNSCESTLSAAEQALLKQPAPPTQKPHTPAPTPIQQILNGK